MLMLLICHCHSSKAGAVISLYCMCVDTGMDNTFYGCRVSRELKKKLCVTNLECQQWVVNKVAGLI